MSAEALSGRTIFTAAELLATDFPEPRFAVPGIIPEGLSFFCGPPKVGKSWLAKNVAIAIASGGHAFGQIPVERGEVLYLGLEDSERRLKERVRLILNGQGTPEGLHLTTSWPPADVGGAEDLGAWLSQHPACRLVVLDVFARLRKPVGDRADRYMADYLAAEPFKRVADSAGVAMVAIHHTRKAQADDFLETVSGTNGLAAAADSIIVLKRSRGKADAELLVTGRDIEEQELALRFDAHIGTWSLLGEAREWQLSETRRHIIEALRDCGPLKPKQIAEEIDADHGVVKHLVRKMLDDGHIDTDGSGVYRVHSVHPFTQSLPLSEPSEWSEGVTGA